MQLRILVHFPFSGMGRVKLAIKKLENSSGRQTTYSKRKNGILKKAHELSVLCDIDLILIMFSPAGKPSFCFGKHSIEEVIAKLNQLPPQERTKRKLEGLEALKKTFKKLDHDVNIQDLLGESTPTIKDLTNQAARIQARLAQIHERLRCWTNPDRISDLEVLMQMEDSLEKSLAFIRREKENFHKRRRVALESSNELCFHVSDEQQLQPPSWTPSDDIQNLVLTEEPKLPAQREIESCTGSTSGNYFGCLSSCLSTGSKSEADSPGQLSGTDNIGQDAFQGLQFGGQYPYLQHGLNMQGDANFQSMLGMDQRQSTATYNAGRNYQPSPLWHSSNSHLPLECPVDSFFGDFSNYQTLTGVPAPTIPSTYETVTRDPIHSHIIFDNTPIQFS